MFCRFCGKELPDDSTFCGYCGKTLPLEDSTDPIMRSTDTTQQINAHTSKSDQAEDVSKKGNNSEFFNKSTRRAPIFLCILAACITLAIVIGVLYIRSDNNPKDDSSTIIKNENESNTNSLTKSNVTYQTDLRSLTSKALHSASQRYPDLSLSDDQIKELVEAGRAYYYGMWSKEHDDSNAWVLFEPAAIAGDDTALYYLGRLCDRRGYVEEAVSIYEQSASLGNHLAKLALGLRYLDGHVYDKDTRKAYLIFKEELDNNHLEAYYGLGLMYADGIEVEQDIDNAEQYFEKLKDSPEPEWQSYTHLGLAKCLLNSNVTHSQRAIHKALTSFRSYHDAISTWSPNDYYRINTCQELLNEPYTALGLAEEMKSACHFNEDAYVYYLIGSWFKNGYIFEQDNEQAFKYMSKSAEMRFLPAMNTLAEMYREGIGTGNNEELANQWEKLAEDRDVRSAFIRDDNSYEIKNTTWAFIERITGVPGDYTQIKTSSKTGEGITNSPQSTDDHEIQGDDIQNEITHVSASDGTQKTLSDRERIALYAEAYKPILIEESVMITTEPYYSYYALFDMDNDGIEELFISHGEDNASWKNDVYTIDGNRAVHAGEYLGNAEYFVDRKNNNDLYFQRVYMGFVRFSVIRLQNNKLIINDLIEDEDIDYDPTHGLTLLDVIDVRSIDFNTFWVDQKEPVNTPADTISVWNDQHVAEIIAANGIHVYLPDREGYSYAYEVDPNEPTDIGYINISGNGIDGEWLMSMEHFKKEVVENADFGAVEDVKIAEQGDDVYYLTFPLDFDMSVQVQEFLTSYKDAIVRSAWAEK